MVILLVDDDEDDQDIFREAVSVVKPDCEVQIAIDGEHGLNKLQEGGKLPDYIFLDVKEVAPGKWMGPANDKGVLRYKEIRRGG